METDNEGSDFARESENESEDEQVLHDEWVTYVSNSIAVQNEDMAIRYLEIVHIVASLPADYLRFLTLAISKNCMRVFDCIVPKYMDSLQIRIGFNAEESALHRQKCMRQCLARTLKRTHGEVVHASTLEHVIHSEIFCPNHEIWQNAFATLFEVEDIEDLHSQSELVLSKFKVLLEKGLNPGVKHSCQKNYSGFDEFMAWCIHTNATNVTIDTGFRLMIAAIQQRFDINKLFTMDTISIIFQSPRHASVPRIPLQCFSEEKTDTILRMLEYFENNLQFWLKGPNAFFSVTNPQIMKYLFSKGISPLQRNENGQTAISSILYQVTQDCILFEHTQDQADELYSCITELLSYKVGLDEKSLSIESALIRPLAFSRPVFEKLNRLFAKILLKAAESRK
jgi:hypothetical protein